MNDMYLEGVDVCCGASDSESSGVLKYVIYAVVIGGLVYYARKVMRQWDEEEAENARLLAEDNRRVEREWRAAEARRTRSTTR